MRITAERGEHGAQAGTDCVDALPDHGFRAVDEEINRETAVHSIRFLRIVVDCYGCDEGGADSQKNYQAAECGTVVNPIVDGPLGIG